MSGRPEMNRRVGRFVVSGIGPLQPMKYGKAAVVGAIGSLAMFAVLFVGIHVTGIAPFNQPPSAAFLTKIGLNIGPLALVVHFGYGAFWSVVLLGWKGNDVSLWSGLGVATGLWALMMLVLSPLIGWGIFGTAPPEVPADHPLYLESPVKYVALTAVLHVLYGAVIGSGNAVWTAERASSGETVGQSVPEHATAGE
jgi:hypothetical protein